MKKVNDEFTKKYFLFMSVVAKRQRLMPINCQEYEFDVNKREGKVDGLHS